MQPKLVVVPSDLPEPPYPEGILARGWAFDMDPERLDRDDAWVIAGAREPEIRPWVLMMFFCSWSNAPCGSYPANDDVISARIRMPLNLFKTHRELLLRGWVRHSDGRLYHALMTEMVQRMATRRDAGKARQARYAAKTTGTSIEQKQSVSQEMTRQSTSLTRIARPTETETGTETDKRSKPKRKNVHELTTTDLEADGLTAALSVEWLEHRQRKKAALTRRAWDAIKVEAAKLHWTPTRAVEKALAKDWRGFEAEWITKGQTQGSEVATGRNWGKVPGV